MNAIFHNAALVVFQRGVIKFRWVIHVVLGRVDGVLHLLDNKRNVGHAIFIEFIEEIRFFGVCALHHHLWLICTR